MPKQPKIPPPTTARPRRKRGAPGRSREQIKSELERSGVTYMLKQCYPTLKSRRN